VDVDSLLIKRRMSKQANETPRALRRYNRRRPESNSNRGRRFDTSICDEDTHISEECLRPQELVGPDDGYDVEKYRQILEQAVKEALLTSDK